MIKKRTDIYYQLPKDASLEELSDKQAGIIFKALNRYNGEREELDTPFLRYVYANYCDHIDNERERYEEYCETQKKRVNKRWNNTTVQNDIPENTAVYHISTSTSESESTSKEDIESSDDDLSKSDDIDADAGVDYHAIVKFFNEETKGVFGTIRDNLSYKRKHHIRARIREHGIEAFYEMIRLAADSHFLKGQNPRNFIASFDWMILPTNFEKIISGNYKNRTDITTPNGDNRDANLGGASDTDTRTGGGENGLQTTGNPAADYIREECRKYGISLP